MTDKSGKTKKPKKSTAAQPSVLGSLPATRPERLGRRNAASTAKPPAAKPVVATATATKPKPKPKPKATRSTAASRAATAEKAAAAKRRADRPAPSPPPPPQDKPRRVTGPPSGPELVTTAIQAAGEIAHIGITVGGQVLKRAARRIPRP